MQNQNLWPSSKRCKSTYPHKRRPIMRIHIELRSYAKAYMTLPRKRTMLLNTRGLKYDLFDHALKYTEENTCATAIAPITKRQRY